MSPILGIWASQISGRLWEPQGAYDALATVTAPSGGLTSVTFAGLPTGYKHLQIRITSAANHANWWAAMAMRFNGDTGSNYSYHDVYGNGSTTVAQGATSQTRMYIGWGSGTTAPSNTFGATILDILDFASTNKNKTVRSLTGIDGNGGGIVSLESNAWLNTSAITSINIFPENGTTFSQYSQFALYGVK